MIKKPYKKCIKILLVLLFWLSIWQCIAMLIGKELLVPTPFQVICRFGQLAATFGFWYTALISLLRILSGYLAALFFGTIIASLTCFSSLADALCRPILSMVKATPVASFIILALLWLNNGIIPAFISFLMVLPLVWANVSQGIRQTNAKFLEVASMFRFGKVKTFRCVYVPSVMPYFISAATTGLGFAWKSGIAAEVLATPLVSIGTNLYESKIYLETVDLFVWTALVVVLSMILEKLLIAAIGRIHRGGEML